MLLPLQHLSSISLIGAGLLSGSKLSHCISQVQLHDPFLFGVLGACILTGTMVGRAVSRRLGV